MPRGGYRPGAGRPVGTGKSGKKPSPKKPAKKAVAKTKKKSKVTAPATVLKAPPPRDTEQVINGVWIPARVDPLTFMLDLLNNEEVDVDTRLRTAIAAAPYCHARKGEGGKKEEKKKASDAASGGKFAAAPPPPNRPN